MLIFRPMKTMSGFILLVGFLALVMAPATCSAGLLVHCCAPEHEEHAEDHHEHDCPTDPCNWDTVAGTTKVQVGGGTTDSAILLVLVVLTDPATSAAEDGTAPPAVVSAGSARSLPLLC
jgi:hypothetical protein